MSFAVFMCPKTVILVLFGKSKENLLCTTNILTAWYLRDECRCRCTHKERAVSSPRERSRSSCWSISRTPSKPAKWNTLHYPNMGDRILGPFYFLLSLPCLPWSEFTRDSTSILDKCSLDIDHTVWLFQARSESTKPALEATPLQLWSPLALRLLLSLWAYRPPCPRLPLPLLHCQSWVFCSTAAQCHPLKTPL